MSTQTTPLPPVIQQPQSHLFSPLGLILICGTLLAIVSIGGGKPKGKLAHAYWGGTTEKSNAQKKGKVQLKSPKIGSTTLYINTPPFGVTGEDGRVTTPIFSFSGVVTGVLGVTTPIFQGF